MRFDNVHNLFQNHLRGSVSAVQKNVQEVQYNSSRGSNIIYDESWKKCCTVIKDREIHMLERKFGKK